MRSGYFGVGAGDLGHFEALHLVGLQRIGLERILRRYDQRRLVAQPLVDDIFGQRDVSLCVSDRTIRKYSIILFS